MIVSDEKQGLDALRFHQGNRTPMRMLIVLMPGNAITCQGVHL